MSVAGLRVFFEVLAMITIALIYLVAVVLSGAVFLTLREK